MTILVKMDLFRAPRAPLLGLLVAAAVLFSSCGGSGFRYVGTSADNAYFKVPSDWAEFDKGQLLTASGLDASSITQTSYRYLIGFDADPQPTIDHVLQLGEVLTYPVVLAWVRQLDFLDHDSYSLASLRNAVYPVDQYLQTHQAEVLSYKDLTLSGGIHGSQIVYNVSGGNYTIASGNQLFRVVQIGLLDPGTKLFYLFMIRCSASCYEVNQGLIDQIVSSWTVKEH